VEPVLALAAQVGELLKQRGETIAVVETSGGGLLSAALLAVPGASAYFVGGAVPYTATARTALLGLAELPPGMRSASEPYARLLAQTARERSGTTWGLAETGASGPTGNRYGDAAGHTCVAVAGPHEAARTLETGSADRLANMYEFTKAALTLLRESLQAPAA
jgi:PncC family amidohydrolase